MRLVLVFCLLALALTQTCPDQGVFTKRWSQVNPAAGTTVTVPAGEKWLFDVANSSLHTGVYILGELVFSDQLDVQLNSFHVTVRNGGIFTIGSCECRYQHKAIIQLGPVPDQAANPDGLGTKVVGCSNGGKINFFGKVFGPTWTNLDKTANVGETTITLTEAVSWRVGDQIVLAPTSFPTWQDPNQPTKWNDRSDEVTITAVSGKVVSFTPALKAMHYSGILQGVDMRGEVAHLTRNILIRGDPDSDTSLFGAHLMFHRNTSVQLHSIEVTRAGQFGTLARYPVHWHMAGSVLGSKIVDSSIHHNYQRSLTIHGTHNVTVERNVAYKTRGHMYFLEDAIERDNVFAWNLGMVNYKILPSQFLPGIASDDAPAIFWITNPWNTFVHNVAVASPAHCFWYALPINPTGPSNTRAVIPRWTPLKKFAYNKAHSCGSDGIHIDRNPNQLGLPDGDDPISVTQYKLTGTKNETITVGSGYYPKAPIQEGGPSDYDYYKTVTKPVNANFEAFTAYKCKGRGAWLRGANLTFTRAQFVDVSCGITFACSDACYCKDATFIHSSENYGMVDSYSQSVGSYGLINNSLTAPFRDIPRDYPNAAASAGTSFGPFYTIRGYEFYDGPNELSGSRFYGYKGDQRANATAISTLREDQFGISAANRLTSVWFDAATTIRVAYPDLVHDADKVSIHRDLDGSLTGYVPVKPEGYSVITNVVPFFFTPGCVMGQNNKHYVCPNHFLQFQFDLNGVSYPADLSTRTTGLVSITRPDKVGSPLYLCGGPCNPGGFEVKDKQKAATSFFGVFMAWRDYYIQFATSIPASWTFRIGTQRSSVNADGLAPYFESTIAVCYPKTATITSVMWNWRDGVTQAASLAAMRTQKYEKAWNLLGNGMWYQDKTTGWVYVRLIIRDTQVATPFGFGEGSWIRINSPGYAATTCTVPSVASIPDTIRTLPPYVGPKVGGTPPAWTAPLSAVTPRSNAVCPAPTPVPVAPVPVPVAPVPVPVAPVPVPVAPVPVPRAPVPVPVAPVPVPVAPVPVPVAPVPVPVAPVPVPRAPVAPVPAPVAVATNFRALGCGIDSSNRALASASTTNSTMTPTLCYNFCKSRGFSIFGVEQGRECYCGTVAFSQGRARFSECNVSCGGDALEPCGGPWRLNFFQAYTCNSGARLEDDSSSGTAGLSDGQIAGIIVGSVIGTLLIVVLVATAWIKARPQGQERV